MTFPYGQFWRGRYDAKAIAEALHRECVNRGWEPTNRNIARLAGVHHRTVIRWRLHQDTVSQHRIADRVEQECGVHISELEAS